MADDTTRSANDSGRGRDADEPTDLPASGWKDIALRVKDEFKTDHVMLTSSGVAFHAFLSLAPLLVAAVSIYGLVADPSNVTKLVDRLGSSVPPALSELIKQQLESVVNSGSGALGIGAAVGIVGALWSASSGVGNLMEAINIAYDEDVDDRPFWKKRGIAIGLTLAIIAFLAVVGTILGFAVGISGTVGIVLAVVAAVVSAALLMGLLAVIYRYAADRDKPEWSWTSVGAVIAVIGWLIASALFTFYVTNFGSYNETYGALGAIVVVLLWMLITAVMIVIGAEINAEMERQTARDTTAGGEEPRGTRDAAAADDVAASPS